MPRQVLARCQACGTATRHPAPRPAAAGLGSELDGRPLAAGTAVTASWRWTCSACGLVAPSLEAARVAVAAGDPEAALRIALQAAWIADDHDPDSAPACREAAAWLARRAGGQDALLADLHRRNGDLDAAVAAARRILDDPRDPRLATLARHQLELVAAGDRGRHSLVDLFAGTAGQAL
jgi:hypothetical protein